MRGPRDNGTQSQHSHPVPRSWFLNLLEEVAGQGQGKYKWKKMQSPKTCPSRYSLTSKGKTVTLQWRNSSDITLNK